MEEQLCKSCYQHIVGKGILDKHDVRDLSGAGDTFLAALVANYVSFHDIRSSIRFANRCAAWVVSQKGVAVVNPDKI